MIRLSAFYDGRGWPRPGTGGRGGGGGCGIGLLASRQHSTATEQFHCISTV